MKFVTLGSIAVAVCAGAGLAASRVQTPPATTSPAANATPSPADLAARFNGIWHLNHDLSTGLTSNAADDGSSGASSGGGRSGSAGRGGRGGRGGGGFGGGGRASGGGLSNEDSLKMHAVTRELGEPPDTMTVIVSPQAVSFTASDGVVRKFASTDKKEKLDLTSATVDVKSKWHGATFEQELSAGPEKIARHYSVSDDGRHLVVDVGPAGQKPDDGNPSSPPTAPRSTAGRGAAVRKMHLVYERAGS